jgi:hypothetical protein
MTNKNLLWTMFVVGLVLIQAGGLLISGLSIGGTLVSVGASFVLTSTLVMFLND